MVLTNISGKKGQQHKPLSKVNTRSEKDGTFSAKKCKEQSECFFVSEAADTEISFNSALLGDNLSWRTKGPIDLKTKVVTLGSEAYTVAQHSTSIKERCSQQWAA